MSESIVQKETPVQSNPFAKSLAGHLNAGTVAIESERAIAEAQGKLVIAKRFPRDQARAYANIIDACKRPGLAEEACYSFPRGGKAVSGPSIRLTEMLAANWGNVDYGLRELSRKDGVSEMEAYCWDLETNTMSSQKFTVRHIRDTQGGGKALTDERDIYELTANMGARRLRARILAILPADLAQAAVDECTKTLAGNNELPIADRIRNMVTAFKNYGVTPDMLEKHLGHGLDSVLPDELAELRKIHISVRDGISNIREWFGGEGEKMEGDPDVEKVNKRPAPKERATKGVAGAQSAASDSKADEKAAAASSPAPVENIQQAMEARDVKVNAAGALTTDAPSGTGSTVPATALPSNPAPAATSPAAKEAEANAAAAAAKPVRAFLKDGERINASIKLDTIMPVFMTIEGVRKACFKGAASGEYQGEYYSQIGTEQTGEKTMKILPPFEVGKSINVVLFGKKSVAPAGNPNHGKIIVWIESLQQAMAEENA